MAAEVAAFAGPREAQGYLGCAIGSPGSIEVEFDGFIEANFDSPLALLTPHLARLTALGGFRRWDRKMARFITDERLQRVFTFQSLYAGCHPQRALAVYAVIAYMDTVCGVFFPRGGMRAVPDALAAAAATPVSIRYGSTVRGLRRGAGSARPRDHRRGQANPRRRGGAQPELPAASAARPRARGGPLPLQPSPSAVVAHVGSARCAKIGSAHHNIFGRPGGRRSTR